MFPRNAATSIYIYIYANKFMTDCECNTNSNTQSHSFQCFHEPLYSLYPSHKSTFIWLLLPTTATVTHKCILHKYWKFDMNTTCKHTFKHACMCTHQHTLFHSLSYTCACAQTHTHLPLNHGRCKVHLRFFHCQSEVLSLLQQIPSLFPVHDCNRQNV